MYSQIDVIHWWYVNISALVSKVLAKTIIVSLLFNILLAKATIVYISW